MKKVNKILSDYIKNNGIKYSFIARKTGIEARIIQMIVNSERYLRADEFIAICIALNLDPNYFLERVKNE